MEPEKATQPDAIKESSFVRRFRAPLEGGLAGAGASYILKNFSDIRTMGNVASWLEKHATTDADRALHSSLKSHLEKNMVTEHFIVDKALLSKAWDVAEREGFGKRPQLRIFKVAVATFLGAIAGEHFARAEKAQDKASELSR